jgi:putative holliday junction resolvase
MRVMGVDPGMKRVGLAVGDTEVGLASPLRTLQRTSDDALVAALTAAARELEAECIVVGLPVRMNGLEGPEAKRARRLCKALALASQLRVVPWDERLTTSLAERQLRASGKKGADKRSRIDQAAATVLLQGYLDAGAP